MSTILRSFCPEIVQFWENVHLVIVKILVYDIPRSCVVLYLGNMWGNVFREERYLLKILLADCKKASQRDGTNQNHQHKMIGWELWVKYMLWNSWLTRSELKRNNVHRNGINGRWWTMFTCKRQDKEDFFRFTFMELILGHKFCTWRNTNWNWNLNFWSWILRKDINVFKIKTTHFFSG